MSKRLTKYSIEYWIKKGLSNEEAEEAVINYKLSQRKNKKMCKEYWIYRGYSDIDALAQISLYQSSQSNKRKHKFTPSQKEFWIRKGFSEEESQYKVSLNIKKTNPFIKESWIRKGFSEEEAKDKIRDIQRSNSSKVKNRRNGRSIEAIMKHGYSEKAAIERLYELQSTNTLEKYISKYGEYIGEYKWEKRKKDWQETLNKKYTKEERRKWSSFTYTDYIEKYGKDRADKWLKNKFCGNKKTYSNIQLKLFNIINERISGDFYFGDKEYLIKCDKGVYMLDFYDPLTKRVIEFNGDFWHGNPNMYNENDICNPWSNQTAKEIWERDQKRIENLLNDSKVNDILIIWESDFNKDNEQTINKCINFLKNGEKIHKNY